MAIAEVLKVTHMMDDKIRLLIDGARKCSLSHVGYPELSMFLAITQQSMDQAGEEKCSSYLNLSLVGSRSQLFL